jgi:hypothetical protein
MQNNREGQPFPIYSASPEQVLATFNDAGDERRFLTGHQWRVSNYALLAFAAITAAPSWVDEDSWLDSGRSWVSVFAFVLVWIVYYLTLRVLRNSEFSLDRQRYRQREARQHLEFLSAVDYSIRSRSEMLRPGKKRDHEQGIDSGPRVKRIFRAVLLLGASIATLINFSRISVPQVVAWLLAFF